MWCTKGTLPTELALSQQHTVDRMSEVGHRALGRLVQPSPPLPVLRRRPAGRTRGCLLRSTPETSRRLRSQIRESPDSPGRFNVHPTAVTDNGDPVGIIAGIRISACTGIVCSRPSLPGTNHQPLEGRLQPQARRWSTDQDTSFDKTRSNGRQNRTNYSTNRDQMYDKTGVL